MGGTMARARRGGGWQTARRNGGRRGIGSPGGDSGTLGRKSQGIARRLWQYIPLLTAPLGSCGGGGLGGVVDRECTFTASVVRAARMSLWNEAERLNAAKTRAIQKALLREAVLLPADNDLPPKDALDTRRRRFQIVLTTSIGGTQYAKQHFRSFVSHPGVEGSDPYDHEFRLMCRVALDGKEVDIPLETRSGIVCALWYKQYHACSDGQYDFQLHRNGCLAKMGKGRLCKPETTPTRLHSSVVVSCNCRAFVGFWMTLLCNLVVSSWVPNSH